MVTVYLLPVGKQAKGGVIVMARVTDPEHHKEIVFCYKMEYV